MNDLDEKLERIAEMLELARGIVEELECGATVESCEDADHAMKEARGLAVLMLARVEP